MGFFSFRAGRILTLSDDGFPACREGRFKKCAKNLSIFPNDQALIKRVGLAVEEAAKKRTFRISDTPSYESGKIEKPWTSGESYIDVQLSVC
jgi:hypothetical protein